jgi:hypothetical protein
MSNTRSLLVALVATAVGACATISVKSDYDREASFTGLQTYDWMETAEETKDEFEAVNPFLERRLQRTVDRALSEQGFQRRTEGEVDFLVSAFIATPPEGAGQDAYSRRPGPRVSFGVGLGSHGYGWWGGYGYGGGFKWSVGYLPIDGLMPGSLVVDVVDAENGDLIWRGWADRALAFAPEELEDLPAFIEETVGKIMATFPPGA